MLETHTLSDSLETEANARRPSGRRRATAFLTQAQACTHLAENRITDIREAAHSERVNIFVDDKFFCSLDISQIVDLKVKIGRILDEEEKAELKKASEFGKFYSLALEYALMRPRSEKELRDYLKRKTVDRHVRVKNRKTGEYQTKVKEGYDESLVPLVMKRLLDRGYVDDRRFAKLWLENRNVSKGCSLKKMRIELLQKGISQAIIDELSEDSERSDQDELKKVINKKRNRYQDKQKFIQYLLRQGFNYSDIVEELSSEDFSFEES